MGEKTGIAWTDSTFNPWWGCLKIDPACEHCYADTLDQRVGGDHWGPAATTKRKPASEKTWREPEKWHARAERDQQRHRVFCASMCDVFEDHPDVGPLRARLWDLIARTPWLDWQLLTKRPENFARFLPPSWFPDAPWPNVWLGVTAGDQAGADKRIPILLKTPAVIRFVSYEPALEMVNFFPYLGGQFNVPKTPTVDWLIAGSESGGRERRPAEDAWYSRVRDLCAETGTAFFMKQAIRNGRMVSLPLLDGKQYAEFPVPR